MSSSNTRKAVVDIADAVKGVFKNYTMNSRRRAWKAITSDKGDEEIERLVKLPSRPTTKFRFLNFAEWLNQEESCQNPDEAHIDQDNS